jgi:hypothetical protein
MKEKSFKEQYKVNLILFITWNVIVLLFSLSSQYYSYKGEDITQHILSRDSLFTIFSPILLIVLNGILSSNLKVFLVFWKWENGLPAHSAFTKYLFADSRINIGRLKDKYGEFPTNPVKQNNLWYSFLTKNKEDTIIKDSHKAYLLTRDMTAISAVFVLSIVVISLSNTHYQMKLLSSAYFILQYMITMVTARNYGRRFVCNVLAIESQI